MSNPHQEPEKKEVIVSEELEAGKPRGKSAEARRKMSEKERALREAYENKPLPKPSYWPLVLAFALVVVLLGVILHPVILGIGVVLVAVAVVGWGLERQ